MPRLPGDHRERQAGRVQPVRRRRAGADEQQAGHVPAARAAGRLHRPAEVVAAAEAIVQAVPRPRQPRRPQAGPGSSTSCRTGASRSSARCSTATTSRTPLAAAEGRADHRPRPAPRLARQGNGKWFLGLSVENGRIKDEGALRLRSGLRAIVSRFKADVRLTTQQDVLLCGIATADRGGGRFDAERVRHPAAGDAVAGAEVEHVLPGDPDVRAGDHRERAGAAGRGRSTRSGADRSGPGRRADQRADDRLPERLRPAVPERGRHRRPRRDEVHALHRRRQLRPAAEHRGAGLGADRADRAEAREGLRGVQGRAHERRVVRRLTARGLDWTD